MTYLHLYNRPFRGVTFAAVQPLDSRRQTCLCHLIIYRKGGVRRVYDKKSFCNVIVTDLSQMLSKYLI